MQIIKRNGTPASFDPNKILVRAIEAGKNLDVPQDLLEQAVIQTQSYLHDGITTRQIDERLASTIQGHNVSEPNADFVAGKILLTTLKKDVAEINYLDNPVLLPSFVERYKKHKKPEREVKMSYFAVSTFLKEFSLRFDGKPSETPTDFYWRVALATAKTDEEIYEFYEDLVCKKFSTANPILVNAGTNQGKLISCTTMSLEEDSLDGITNTLKSAAIHSSNNSGIGIYVGDIRSKQSQRSKGGYAAGLRRLVKLAIPYSDFFQQHETRRGAFALYCDMWHLDIEDFIPMKRPDLSHTLTEKNGFYGVCIPDLFYKRFRNNEIWTLFCPEDIRKVYNFNLSDFHGKDFEERYLMIEEEDVIKNKKVPAKDLMQLLVENQAASGVPYVFNRDNANRKHQQSYLGTLKSYQLCLEFAGIHNNEYEAQCCLGSMNLPAFVDEHGFNFKELERSTKVLTRLLNNVIDINEFNTPKAEKAGKEHRNIGIGFLGLADVFAMMDLTYGLEEKSRLLNQDIQKTIYLSALSASNEIAKENPLVASKRTLVVTNPEKFDFIDVQLAESIKEHGVANELLCCNMPTSTTSKLLDCNPSFEVFDFPVSVRKTVSGEYKLINHHLVRDLKKEGKWNVSNINLLLSKNDVKFLDCTEWVKQKYINKYEHGNKVYLDMAADRQMYIDQGQSMNLYYATNEAPKIATALVYGWEKGLPSGSYYCTVVNSLQGTTDVVQQYKEKPSNTKFECFGCD